MPRLRVPNLACALVIAAWVLASAETLLFAPGAREVLRAGLWHGVAVAALGSGLASVPALGLGAGAWLVLRFASRWETVAGRVRRLGDWLDGSRGADRAGVVEQHVRGAALVIATLLLVVVSRFVLGRLWRLQATDLAVWLAVVAVVLLAAVWRLGAVGLSRLLFPAVSWLDRRWPLPWPRDLLARLTLWVIPPALLGLAVLDRQRHLLGRTAFAPYLGILGLTALVAGVGCRRLSARLGRPAAGLRRGVVGLALVGVVTVAAAGPGRLALLGQAEQSLGASLGARLLRWLSDVDRDGAPAWVGGADCAPFDPARSPLRQEIAQNGVDEDCDGKDGDAEPAAPLGPRRVWPAASARRFHVVWLIPDGVRADRLGVYGQPRALTPALDGLAAESVRFEQAFAQSSATAFSFFSMFAGRNPQAMQWETVGAWPSADARHRTVAERFRALGYRTAIFVNGWVKRVYPGLLRGFDTVVTPEVSEDWAYWSQQTSPMFTTRAIELIERLDPSAGPLFLVLHYDDTHFPYVAHPRIPTLGPQPLDAYDGEVAFTDHAIGSLLDYLRYRRPLWDDTVVVMTSDHGEEFGEHGREHHGRTCHTESTRVPLLLRVPGLAPAVVDTPVGLLDIVPTLLELVGAPLPAELQGQSLLASASGAPPASPRPIFCAVASQYSSPEPFLQHAVRRGGYLLLEERFGHESQLYDHLSDPDERVDRSTDAAFARVRDELRDELRQARTGNLGEVAATP